MAPDTPPDRNAELIRSGRRYADIPPDGFYSGAPCQPKPPTERGWTPIGVADSGAIVFTRPIDEQTREAVRDQLDRALADFLQVARQLDLFVDHIRAVDRTFENEVSPR